MNTGRSIPNLIQWFENRSFIMKLLLAYFTCGVIPIAVMMAYYFISTSNLLREQAYQGIRQDSVSIENSLNTIFQPYEAILENYKNDKELNTLLGLDYSNISFSDLAYYVDTELDDITAIYPSVSWIRFYSTNQTLPDDRFYFHSLEELDEELLDDLNGVSGSILASSWLSQQGEDEILLLTAMNYFSSNQVVNYIALGIDASDLSDIFYMEGIRSGYLADSDGVILFSSQEEKIGTNMRDTIPGWKQLSVGSLEGAANKDGEGLVVCVNELDMGLSLILTMDEGTIIEQAMNAPLRMLYAFLAFTLLLLIPVALYSRRLNRRLQRIIGATEDIGAGNFDWEIEDTSKDEFGQITQAVNQMSRQIDGLIRENYRKQLEINISDLNLLQEQINPHFLYNALAVISSMALREGAAQTIQCIRYLADFYRTSLNKGRQVIHVREEVELLKNYMKIQMIRFSDILEIEYSVEERIENYYTLKLLLQPLVENAIHHAREEETFLHIKVHVYMRIGRICYDVIDDGKGMDAATLKKLREELLRQDDGFGLKNVDKRIKLNYGKEFGASVYSELGKGTRIHLEIPARDYR